MNQDASLHRGTAVGLARATEPGRSARWETARADLAADWEPDQQSCCGTQVEVDAHHHRHLRYRLGEPCVVLHSKDALLALASPPSAL